MLDVCVIFLLIVFTWRKNTIINPEQLSAFVFCNKKCLGP